MDAVLTFISGVFRFLPVSVLFAGWMDECKHRRAIFVVIYKSISL